MKKVYLLLVLIVLHFFPNYAYSAFNTNTLKYFRSTNECNPSEAKNYLPGKTKGGNSIPVNGGTTNYALTTEGDGHISLGFGGSIILKYEGVVPNLPGNDIIILEGALGSDCASRKTRATVYASQDEVNWTYIDKGCQDLTLDFPATLKWAKYFKIIDISDPEDFTSADADGYHLDGMKSINCPGNPTLDIDIFVDCVIKNPNGSYTAKFGYYNPNPVVYERPLDEKFNYIKHLDSETQPQTVYFEPGRVYNAFSVSFDRPSITWTLLQPDGKNTKEKTVSASATNCNNATIRGGGDICEGETAQIYINFAGTTPWSFAYTDTEGNITEIKDMAQTSYSFVSSKSTTYTLFSVTNSDGAGSVFGSATIQVNSKPTATLTGSGFVCGTNTSSPLTISLTENPPFDLTYTDGTSTFNQRITTNTYSFPGLLGKTYSLISVRAISSACDGSVTGKVLIAQSSDISATIGGSATICGKNKASIEINFTGAGPWDLTLNNGLEDSLISGITANPLIIDLPVGTYSLTSVKQGECIGTVKGKATVSSSTQPTGVMSGGGSTCADGQAPVNIAFTGEPPFAFVYTDGTVSFLQTGYTSNSFTFNGIAGKNYQLTSLNNYQCEGLVSGTAEVVLRPAPTAIMSGSKYICTSEETSTISINITGIIPYTIVYSDGNKEVTVTDILSSPYNLEVKGEGQYKLISVKDARCVGEVEGKADIITPDFKADLNLATTYCYGSPIELTPKIEVGDVQSYNWTTSGNGYFFNAHENTTRYIPGFEETGDISFTLTVVGRCRTQTFSWKTIINQKLDASFTFSPKEEILTGDPVLFTPNNSDGDSYHWYIGTKDGGTGNPFEYVFERSGNYKVILALEKAGCYQLDTVIVKVGGQTTEIFVPNIFSQYATSPESRVVKVYGENISLDNFTFKIFNKWGKVLYQTTDFVEANTRGWDGRAASNGEYQPLGVYTYSVEGKYNDDVPFKKVGTVTLAK